MASNKKTELTQQQAFEQLRLQIGKTVVFRGAKFTISDAVEYGQNQFQILKDSGAAITIALDKVATFIAELFIVEPETPPSVLPVMQTPQVVEIAPTKSELMLDDMASDLYGVFQTLKAQPTKENIDQATAMANTANTITNLMKLRLSAAKLASKR